MDASFLSAMLTLNGKNNCGANLTKVSRIMNACSGLNKDGTAQKSLFSLLGELNPQYRSALTIFDKIKAPAIAPAQMPAGAKDSAAPAACATVPQFNASPPAACATVPQFNASPPAACPSGKNGQAACSVRPVNENRQAAHIACSNGESNQAASAPISPFADINMSGSPNAYEPFIQYNNPSAHVVHPIKETRQAAHSANPPRENWQASHTACPVRKNNQAASTPASAFAEAKKGNVFANASEPFVQYNNETLRKL